MNDEPDSEDLRYWVDLMNGRGHAGIFATANTPGVTEIVERSVVRDFAKAMRSLFGVCVEKITTNPHDPPDCLAEIEGRQVQIELVELVDGNALRIAKTSGRTAFNDRRQFLETQWNAERFVKEVNALIDRKDGRYQAKGKVFDCLVIYTAEPLLLPQDVLNWLDVYEFQHRDSFRSIFLLMAYSPSYSQDHSPLFKLYGNLGNG